MKVKTQSKPKIWRVIAIALIVVVAGLFIASYIYEANMRAADKQRFESALENINKYFDALGGLVKDRQVDRTCDYGVGPWGDSGNLQCNVIVRGVVEFSQNDYLSKFDDSKTKLEWQDMKSSFTDGTRSEGTAYWIGGKVSGIDCYGSIDNENRVNFYCHGRTDFQHYRRVDR